MSMIRSREWKFVHFVDGGYGQLFNLKADPGEFRNLWNDPAHAPVKQRLLGELLNWRIRGGISLTR